MIEPEMLEYLQTAGTGATNYYLKVAPGNAIAPYGTIFKVAPGRDYTHDGASGLHDSVMQVSCWGKTYRSAKLMAYKVVEEMEDWLTSEDEVQAVFLQSEVDLYEDDTKTHHIVLQFVVWHTF